MADASAARPRSDTPRLQVGPLSKGVHIVVATPGRLIDLMEQGAINLAEVSFLVLDEADRMLDMGFEREIKMVMSKSRPDRQTLMFSATWPMEVQDIGRSYMRTPVRVDIGEKDRLTANHKVKQIVEVMENHQKDARLVQLLEKYHKGQKERMLVFCLYKKETQRVETMLQRKGYAAQCINGDLNQDKRTQVLEDFKAGKLKCMVATDVAARGLDVKELGFVINYTFPLTIEDYVHRIGRTGRAGASGLAHTFFTKEDKAHAGALGNILREAGVEVRPALFGRCCQARLPAPHPGWQTVPRRGPAAQHSATGTPSRTNRAASYPFVCGAGAPGADELWPGHEAEETCSVRRAHGNARSSQGRQGHACDF